jgi:adenylate cyclase
MRRSLALLALAVAAAFLLELLVLCWITPLENRLLDSMARLQAAGLAPDPEIVLVDIDERSLAALEQDAGRWPWSRAVYVDLIEGLAAQKPRAIVFDMMFVEKDGFRPQDDAAFAETAVKHANTYFALLRLPESSDAKGVRIADHAVQFRLARTPDADPHARIALVPPLALPSETYGRAGLITFKADADGIGRRYLLRETVAGWQIPSLPARVASDLGYRVPDQDTLVLAWRGPANGFPRVSFVDLYEDFQRAARKRPANEFEGKIVIIGTAATGLQDLRVTPMHSLHPGAEILGTAIENLKNGRAMRYAPAWWPLLAGLALLTLVYAAFLRRLDVRVTGAALAVASALLVAGQFVLVGRLTLLPLLTPLGAAWSFFGAAGLAEYLRERRARREAVAQFSRFVNPHVVQQLVEHGGIKGAGRREVTLLFSDIRGFTTLSESRTPEEVVDLLNRYFTLQVDVVVRHGGSLDKYIGDCIMAIWGAPLDDTQHARNAVACALDMADALQAFKKELGAEHLEFDVGIGLHSGPAVLGFIGSRKREYTAIGDTVNLGSRIEGLTKGVARILISEDTMRRCQGAFDFVDHGQHVVKGRERPVRLFEPVRRRS